MSASPADRFQVKLPAQVHVIVRDWLNSNSLLIRGSRETALIDSGYSACAGETLRLLQRPEALGARRLDRLVNTHCHSDHVGGNAALRSAYRCRVSIPQGEAPLVAHWDTRALWLDYADQYCDPFLYDDVIAPGERLTLGDLEWEAIPVPGHDMGALAFYCEEARLLVSGDALWEHGFGVIAPESGEPVRLKAAREALEALARLDVHSVIPGHGPPFGDVEAALERAFKRLEAFQADPCRTARHFLKVMLMFSLLEKGRMALAALPAYLEAVDAYREVNRRFLGLPAAGLAERLVAELERSGALTRRDGFIFPAAAGARA
jgi:glyoxylase-like metal-dependent hydrolase (beta-lactamase superfamily II)